MTSTDFKTALTKIKETLIGKTLKIDFVYGNSVDRMSFNTLASFGKAVLELEALGASFGFLSVSNDLIERATPKHEDFIKRINSGKWNEYKFLATTVKL